MSSSQYEEVTAEHPCRINNYYNNKDFQLTAIAFCSFFCADDDCKKYLERQQRKPVQVPVVDSCGPRTQEREGITLYDNPQGMVSF